jgi:hypothetical protein
MVDFLFQTPRQASASVSNPRAHMVKTPSGSHIQQPSASPSASSGKTGGRAGSSKRGFQHFHKTQTRFFILELCFFFVM